MSNKNLKLKIPGQLDKTEAGREVDLGDFDIFQAEVVDAYDLETTRDQSQELIEREVTPDEIVELEMEEGVVFYLSQNSYRELTGAQAREVTEEGFIAPIQLDLAGSTRGVKSFFVKTLRFIRLASNTGPLADEAAGAIARKLEEKLPYGPGLYRCSNERFKLNRITAAIPDNVPVLLFIHGTASSTEGSFGDLWGGPQSAFWRSYAQKTYGEHVYAFEHRTLSESPLDNLQQLLEALPDRARLHLVTHSRGGLVGELLCRGQMADGSEPFSGPMLDLFKPKSTDSEERREVIRAQYQTLKTLNQLLSKKQIKVERFARIACPARGTTLASKRLDLYFSIVLNALGLIPVLRISPAYHFVKALLLGIANERTQVEDLPGLEAMMPSSNLINLVNWPWPASSADLSVIAGDIQASGLSQTLAVFVTDLLFQDQHDLVVDTQSMVGGAVRSEGIRRSFHQGSEVSHFSYFSNHGSVQKLIDALARTDGHNAGFELVSPGFPVVQRGGIEPFETNNQPIIYVLPELFGSRLELDNEPVWMEMKSLVEGGFSKLGMSASGVKATGLYGETYATLIEFLKQSHRVIPFPYDWRKSIHESAKELALDLKKVLAATRQNSAPIRILAHSQGGLVARAMIASYPEIWSEAGERQGSRLLMLGTPNHGSLSIAGLLLGLERLPKILDMLDSKASKKKILRQLASYPGLLEMLPASGEYDFFASKVWRQFDVERSGDAVIPRREALRNAEIARSKIDQQLRGFNAGGFDPSRVFQVAGQAPDTPTGLKFDGAEDKQELRYVCTDEGDGFSAWASMQVQGIKTWFAEAGHGDMLSNQEDFPALLDILENGYTVRLPDTQPATRRTASSAGKLKDILLFPDERNLAQAAFLSPGQAPRSSTAHPRLHVSITHGDLLYADYPVAVGHYQDDQIIGAEKVLDQKLNGRMTKNLELGIYPGRTETSNVFFASDIDRRSYPSGAIVVGLGIRGRLSGSLLQTCIAHAMLDYIRAAYEQGFVHKKDLGVSFLLISTGVGGLTLEDALSAILRGVSEANCAVGKEGFNGLQIRKVQFIEIYLDRSVRATRVLREICASEEFKPFVRFMPFIQNGIGKRERIPHDKNRSVWQRLQILTNEFGALRYTYLTQRARADATLVKTQRHLIDCFIDQAINTSRSNTELATTLFEMLVPKEFKHQAPHQDDVLLILNEDSARYPWEFLQQKIGEEIMPLSVQSGMIRQLVLESDGSPPPRINYQSSNALVIGDPIINSPKFPQLAGAREEAEVVTRLLHGRFDKVEQKIQKSAGEIIMTLCTRPYRILHLAGHGVYEHQNGQGDSAENITGMVLSDGVFLTPSEVRQMPSVPELVFINCCHLGYVENNNGNRFATDLKPHLLAANLATQFIKEGVRCVVAAGWAVVDAAASSFAEKFYSEMVEKNATFGEAIQKARKRIYEDFPGINTWGAYQCYGDPHFRLDLTPGVQRKHKQQNRMSTLEGFDFTAPHELSLELHDLATEAGVASPQCILQLAEKLQDLMQRMPPDWREDPALLAAIGRAWKELGQFGKAAPYYRQAITAGNSELSFETMHQYLDSLINYVQQQKETGKQADERIIKEIFKRILQLSGMVEIAPTASRLTVIANAYQRLATVAKDQQRIEAINGTIRFYQQANEAAQKETGEVDPHLILQWQAGVIVKNWRSRKNELIGFKESLDQAGVAIQQKFSQKPTLQTRIDKAELRLLRLLGGDSKSADKNNVEKHIAEITANYKEALGCTTSADNNQEVKDTINFLTTLSSSRRTRAASTARANLLEIVNALKLDLQV